MTRTFELRQIGKIRRENDKVYVSISEKYQKALTQLDKFSHAQIYWWADQNDNEEKRAILDTVPPYGDNPPRTGIFASRAEYRPNPIAMTTVKIINIENGEMEINNIDAFDDTPVIDVKAYFAVCDRVENSHLPEWITGWPDFYPEEGFGLN